MISPKQAFDAWRDDDLLGFDPPKDGETYQQYRDRVGDEALAGDGLFHFVLAELCGEDISPAEAGDRLVRAAIDLLTVREKL